LAFTSLDYSQTDAPTHAVILLHGWGANAQDLASLAPLLKLPSVKFIFPNAPHPHPFSAQGRMWYDLETQKYLEETRRDLKSWLRSLPETLNLPLDKIFLGGFSQGGAMTLDVGHDFPLAGLMCLSGYLHPHLDFRPVDAKPTLVIHGRQDPVVPIQAARLTQQKLTQSQWNIEFHELAMAHEITPQVLELIQAFLERQCSD
jgi:phospholipase/carboxylesterase